MRPHDKVATRHGTSLCSRYLAWSGLGWAGLVTLLEWADQISVGIIGEIPAQVAACLTRDGSSHYNFLNCSQPTLSLILLPHPPHITATTTATGGSHVFAKHPVSQTQDLQPEHFALWFYVSPVWQ